MHSINTERGDLKNVIKSKRLILFGFNKYEHNIDMKTLSFLKFNSPKRETYCPKMTSCK